MRYGINTSRFKKQLSLNLTELNFLYLQHSVFCPKCGAGFTRKDAMKRHDRFNHPVEGNEKEGVRCRMEGCHSTFRDNLDLTRHLLTKHFSGKNFPCPVCDKSFATVKNKRYHQKRLGHWSPALD